MKFTFLFASAAVVLATSAQAGGPPTEWGYEGPKDARHWGQLDPLFKTCSAGKRQSPINLDVSEVEKGGLKPIPFSYKAGAADVLNNGHTLQINVANSGTARFDGIEYRLVNVHFHTPSEEKINSMLSHMSAHFFHRAGDLKLAVVAVNFKLGKENAVLKPMFDNMPDKEGKKFALASFNPADILPADPTYFFYMGSLTEPPCTEDVKWYVMKTPLEISFAQLDAFKKLFRMNARYTQAINGRRIQMMVPEGEGAPVSPPAGKGSKASGH
jgi:carbonic anhydrase